MLVLKYTKMTKWHMLYTKTCSVSLSGKNLLIAKKQKKLLSLFAKNLLTCYSPN